VWWEGYVAEKAWDDSRQHGEARGARRGDVRRMGDEPPSMGGGVLSNRRCQTHVKW